MSVPSSVSVPGENKAVFERFSQRVRRNFIQPDVRYTEQLPEQFIPARLPSEIFYNGASVEFHIFRHHDYRNHDPLGRVAKLLHADLARVFFRGWDLSGIDFAYSDFVLADLSGACLEGANLDGVRGNGREIKSALFGTWPVVWTRCPDYGDYVQIGCQRHHLSKWERSDPRWIRALYPDGENTAEDFWDAHGQVILSMVKSSPAEAWGYPSRTGRNSGNGQGGLS